MKKKFVFWAERYLYDPTPFDRIVSFCLLPLSVVYCIVVFFRFLASRPQNLGIKVVSVGNVTLGGSGKTPFAIAVAKRYGNVAIVLRGYGRKSKGMIVVKDRDKLLCDDASLCGDEALVYAEKLSQAVVIVSEDRKKAIKKARSMGVSFVILDDGYAKHAIEKFDVLIDVRTQNDRCLPSGPYREKVWKRNDIIRIEEGKDFTRRVYIRNQTQKMVLVTAIAKPNRLEEYLPETVVAKYFFEDHYAFSASDIEKIIQNDHPQSILVTMKDYVKVRRFADKISLMDMEIEIAPYVFQKIDEYLQKK